MKILVMVEARDGVVQPVSRELLRAARDLSGVDGTVEALLLDTGTETAAALGRSADVALCGVDASFAHPTAEAYAAVLAEVVASRKPDAVFCAYSALGLDVAPNLAARTELPLVAYCVKLQALGNTVEARSQIYAGKFLADTHVPLPAIFAINPGSFAEAATVGDAPEIVSVDVSSILPQLKVVFLDEALPDPNAVDLTKAERIVCVGRGIKDKDSIALAQAVADLLSAEIAGSRPVVDSGWLAKERQVGKSGRKVKPKLYVALGVSGAPEHIEGMGRSDLIVAINSDAGAPIFDVAHYAATCDLFELLPALTERLEDARSQ